MGNKFKGDEARDRGYKNAKKAIKEGEDPFKLLDQARSSLTRDDYDEGWKKSL